jgi:hypothetical protein
MQATNNLKDKIMELPHIVLDQAQRKLATIFAWVGGFTALLYVIKTGLLPFELHKPFLVMYISTFTCWTVGFILGILSINLNVKE